MRERERERERTMEPQEREIEREIEREREVFLFVRSLLGCNSARGKPPSPEPRHRERGRTGEPGKRRKKVLRRRGVLKK